MPEIPRPGPESPKENTRIRAEGFINTFIGNPTVSKDIRSSWQRLSNEEQGAVATVLIKAQVAPGMLPAEQARGADARLLLSQVTFTREVFTQAARVYAESVNAIDENTPPETLNALEATAPVLADRMKALGPRKAAAPRVSPEEGAERTFAESVYRLVQKVDGHGRIASQIVDLDQIIPRRAPKALTTKEQKLLADYRQAKEQEGAVQNTQRQAQEGLSPKEIARRRLVRAMYKGRSLEQIADIVERPDTPDREALITTIRKDAEELIEAGLITPVAKDPTVDALRGNVKQRLRGLGLRPTAVEKVVGYDRWRKVPDQDIQPDAENRPQDPGTELPTGFSVNPETHLPEDARNPWSFVKMLFRSGGEKTLAAAPADMAQRLVSGIPRTLKEYWRQRVAEHNATLTEGETPMDADATFAQHITDREQVARYDAFGSRLEELSQRVGPLDDPDPEVRAQRLAAFSEEFTALYAGVNELMSSPDAIEGPVMIRNNVNQLRSEGVPEYVLDQLNDEGVFQKFVTGLDDLRRIVRSPGASPEMVQAALGAMPLYSEVIDGLAFPEDATDEERERIIETLVSLPVVEALDNRADEIFALSEVDPASHDIRAAFEEMYWGTMKDIHGPARAEQMRAEEDEQPGDSPRKPGPGTPHRDDFADTVSRSERRALTPHLLTWTDARPKDLAERFGVHINTVYQDIEASEALAVRRILQRTDQEPGAPAEFVTADEALDRLREVKVAFWERLTKVTDEVDQLRAEGKWEEARNVAKIRDRIRHDPAYTRVKREEEIVMNRQAGMEEPRRSVLDPKPAVVSPRSQRKQENLEALPGMWGAPREQIADELGVSPGRVSRYARILRERGVELESKVGRRPDPEAAARTRRVEELMDQGLSPRAIRERLGEDQNRIKDIMTTIRRARGEQREDPEAAARREREKTLLAAGFSAVEVGKLVNKPTALIYKNLQRLSPEERQAMGIKPGRRAAPDEEAQRRRAEGLAAVGIDPEEAARRLRGEQIPDQSKSEGQDVPQQEPEKRSPDVKELAIQTPEVKAHVVDVFDLYTGESPSREEPAKIQEADDATDILTHYGIRTRQPEAPQPEQPPTQQPSRKIEPPIMEAGE